MPGIDGWTVLASLKADPELRNTPVIMVSFVNQRGLAASLGAADYLSKPVNWDRFRRVIDRYRDAAGEVLLVDDDAELCRQIRHLLEADGWSVAEATNGAEALDYVSRSTPRVVLLDLVMPVMDGFAFLQALRERPGCADIPVIVLTARDLSQADRLQLRGADQVLTKNIANLRDLGMGLRALTTREPT